MSTNYSSFEELTNSASKYLTDIGRRKQTVIIYNWIWKKVKVYMDNERIEKCTPKTIVDYLNLTYGDQPISKLTHHQKHCLRCALCLAQFAETNKMVEIIGRREVLAFEDEIGLQMNQYIDYKGSMRLNPRTLRGHSWYLYQFLKHLNACGIFSTGLLSPLVIMKYASNLLPEAAGAKHLALSIIKNFLRYLHEKEETKKDLSLIVPKDNYKKQAHLPSTYTKAEVCMILDSIDRSTTTGKRNYAILMLAVRLGLLLILAAWNSGICYGARI